MMDAPYGVFIDGAACRANLQTGVTVFKNNIVAGNIQAVDPSTAGYATVKDSLFSATQFKNDSLVSTSGILVTPYDFTAPDYRPSSGSLALSNVNFTDAAFNGCVIVVTKILLQPCTRINTPVWCKLVTKTRRKLVSI